MGAPLLLPDEISRRVAACPWRGGPGVAAVQKQAAGWLAESVPVRELARRLRVSPTAVYGWQQRWRVGARRPWP